MTDPLPTFTIGVGQAGIAMMNTLAETAERNDSEEFFDYFAIDTDGDTLGSVPTGTTRVRLNVSDAHLDEDMATYPYLTEDTEVGGKGAERQRPVGRYKLDSRGHETFDDYFESLWYDILEHYQEVDYSFEQDRDSYNIFLLHSLGGGTGSGTFPLLSAMLNRIAQRIEDQNDNVDVYVGGVGVAPQVDFNPEVTNPPGEEMYYPNTYSALSDLSNLLDADAEALDIPIYSKSFGQGGSLSNIDERVEESFTGNSIPIERVPYNDYWLVGVDENLITSGTGTDFVEGYRDQINRRVAESIYALSEMEQSVENWSSRAKGTAPLGTVGHAQLQVPHEQLRKFCEMKDERDEKQTLVTETIPDQLDDLRSEKDDLEEIKQDPASINEYLDSVSDWEENFRGRFESQLGAGNALVRNSAAEDVTRVLDAIEAEATPEVPEGEGTEESDEPEDLEDIRADQRAEQLLVATEILDEMFQAPNAAPAVENHWEETVSKQWRTYDMAGRTKYGGSAPSTLEGEGEALKNFYSEKIDEF